MIVIIGASGKLGGALAETFALKGKKVINLSRNPTSKGPESIKLDLLEPASIKQAADQINAMDEPLEALLNCAGVFSQQPLNAMTSDDIRRTFATNVEGPMLLTSLVMDKAKKDGADIVNVASSVGIKAQLGQAAYGASKWAMRGFSANLQLELKDHPCRVISFSPGSFENKLATGKDNATSGNSMSAEDLAAFIAQILELPKSMEVSEVIINRK